MFIQNKDDLYFTDDDFDTFKEEYQSLNTQEIRGKRDVVKQKLLNLNPSILDLLHSNGINLYNHPDNKRHTTSLTTPCEYNKGKVNWLGIRYGKSPKLLSEMNQFLDKKDSKLGFQKYACMQINVCYSGVEVGIYHSVPRDAQDRLVLRNNILNPEFQQKVYNELQKIKGYGFKWHVWNTIEEKEYTFDFDNTDCTDFPKWYLEHDVEGCYSSMLLHLCRYSEYLNTCNIVNTCFQIISKLWDLYKVISWQPNL